MSYRVVSVEQTPNPNALKFLLDRAVCDKPVSFFNAQAAAGNALAEKLFAIAGVTSVLMLGDFVTVNKGADRDWKGIREGVKRVLEGA